MTAAPASLTAVAESAAAAFERAGVEPVAGEAGGGES